MILKWIFEDARERQVLILWLSVFQMMGPWVRIVLFASRELKQLLQWIFLTLASSKGNWSCIHRKGVLIALFFKPIGPDSTPIVILVWGDHYTSQVPILVRVQHVGHIGPWTQPYCSLYKVSFKSRNLLIVSTHMWHDQGKWVACRRFSILSLWHHFLLTYKYYILMQTP